MAVKVASRKTPNIEGIVKEIDQSDSKVIVYDNNIEDIENNG
jgi:hypothetical protein